MVIAMFKTVKREDINAAEYQKAVATFDSEEALEACRSHPEHRATQKRGSEEFYDSLRVKACNVVREYEWKRPT